MIEVDKPVYDVGVIIGRFQTPGLTRGHLQLIEDAHERHRKVVVLLGISPLTPSRRNPLDYQSRALMINSWRPSTIVLPLQDAPGNDELWSQGVDRVISSALAPSQSAVLYGSRDSFIPAYSGRYPTIALEASLRDTATQARDIARVHIAGSADWRAGAVWSAANRFPTAYQTVDVAVLDELGRYVLLGRKAHETELRFIGGFSDPASPSLEADVRREVSEEAQIDITDPAYIGSTLIDDPRYRGEDDRIKTAMFVARIRSGEPHAGDDLAEVHWVDLEELLRGDIDLVAAHRPLLELLRAYDTTRTALEA